METKKTVGVPAHLTVALVLFFLAAFGVDMAFGKDKATDRQQQKMEEKGEKKKNNWRWLLYGGSSSYSPVFFKNIWSRRNEYFSGLGFAESGRPTEFNIGTGFVFPNDGHLFWGFAAQGGSLQSSDSKSTSSTWSSALSTIFFLPFSEYEISTTSTFKSLLGFFLFGGHFESSVVIWEPHFRLGAGRGWYTEEWRIQSLSTSTTNTELSYEGSALFWDASVGLNVMIRRFLLSGYFGFRQFKAGELSKSVTKGSEPSGIGTRDANFQGTYYSVNIGVAI